MNEKDVRFLREAIRLSEQAVIHGNEPFGAVLVKNGQIVRTAENRIYTENDPTYHAEMGLLRDYVRETGITDLSEYTLYSSCEPCFMCSGAMVWLKLGRLVYGASDRDLCNLLGVEGSDPVQLTFQGAGFPCHVEKGVLQEESLAVLRNYFKNHTKG